MERRDIRSKECMFAVHRGFIDGEHFTAVRIHHHGSVSGHYAILELTTDKTYYIAYIDGVNYGWIADPKAFVKKMKAYQLPRKSGTMEIKKITIWGEETETYHVACFPKFIHITGPNGYELEGTNRGEVQRKFNLHHDPFNTI